MNKQVNKTNVAKKMKYKLKNIKNKTKILILFYCLYYKEEKIIYI